MPDSEGARCLSLIPRVRRSWPGLSSCRKMCGAAKLPTRASDGSCHTVRQKSDLQIHVVSRLEGLTVRGAVVVVQLPGRLLLSAGTAGRSQGVWCK